MPKIKKGQKPELPLDTRSVVGETIDDAHRFVDRYGTRMSTRLCNSLIAQFDGHEGLPQLCERLQAVRQS